MTPGLSAPLTAILGGTALVYLALLAWGPLTVLRRPLPIVVFGVLLVAGVWLLRAQVLREQAAQAPDVARGHPAGMRLIDRARDLLADEQSGTDVHPEPLAWLSRPIAGRTVPARLVELIRACVDRIVRIQFVDRSIALGSLAFTALVPLLVIVAAYAPGSEGIAATLIDRFELDGTSAELVRQVFTPTSGSTDSAISIPGVLLLTGSALSFTRGLQRLYELSWRLQARGWLGTVAGLKWLGMVAIWFGLFGGVRTWLLDHTGPLVSLVIALSTGGILWLFTPFVLLAGRVAWQKLVPTALLTVDRHDRPLDRLGHLHAGRDRRVGRPLRLDRDRDRDRLVAGRDRLRADLLRRRRRRPRRRDRQSAAAGRRA